MASGCFIHLQVVLSVRDPKAWHKSVTESIFQFFMMLQTSWTVPLLLKMLDRRRGSGRDNLVVLECCKYRFKRSISPDLNQGHLPPHPTPPPSPYLPHSSSLTRHPSFLTPHHSPSSLTTPHSHLLSHPAPILPPLHTSSLFPPPPHSPLLTHPSPLFPNP